MSPTQLMTIVLLGESNISPLDQYELKVSCNTISK